MQIAALIGISDDTQNLYQVYKSGILLGTMNAVNANAAKEICADKYNPVIDWRELSTLEVMRS